MKKCIWCLKTENETKFDKIAHTFPKSLNGERICINVCDGCNFYFGATQPNVPSVEITLKEVLNLSRYILLHPTGNKYSKRYKSEFFDVNWEKRKMKLKSRFKLNNSFQKLLGRQFRRGVYKVFLEERDNQRQDALDDRFNFIREFARYDRGNIPVFYFIPKFKIVPFSLPDVIKPTIRFTENSDQIDAEFRFYEYHFTGHYLGFPTSSIYPITLKLYKDHLKRTNHAFGIELKEIENINDIDFRFLFMRDRLPFPGEL